MSYQLCWSTKLHSTASYRLYQRGKSWYWNKIFHSNKLLVWFEGWLAPKQRSSSYIGSCNAGITRCILINNSNIHLRINNCVARIHTRRVLSFRFMNSVDREDSLKSRRAHVILLRERPYYQEPITYSLLGLRKLTLLYGTREPLGRARVPGVLEWTVPHGRYKWHDISCPPTSSLGARMRSYRHPGVDLTLV